MLAEVEIDRRRRPAEMSSGGGNAAAKIGGFT